MIYPVLFISSIFLVGFYTFFEIAYLLTPKLAFYRYPDYLKNFLFKPERVIITVLVGTNLWAITASMIYRRWTGIEGNGIEGSLTVSILLFIFSEMLPKNIALFSGRKLFPYVATVIYMTYLIFKPLIVGVEYITKLFNIEDSKPESSVSNLHTFISELKKSGMLDKEQEKKLNFIQKLEETLQMPVKDFLRRCMYGYALGDRNFRYEEFCIMEWDEINVDEIQKSRFCVIKKDDKVLGIINSRDVYLIKKKILNLKQAIEKPVFVFEEAKVKEVLKAMKDHQKTVAIIVDEYGLMSDVFTVRRFLKYLVKQGGMP